MTAWGFVWLQGCSGLRAEGLGVSGSQTRFDEAPLDDLVLKS